MHFWAAKNKIICLFTINLNSGADGISGSFHLSMGKSIRNRFNVGFLKNH